MRILSIAAVLFLSTLLRGGAEPSQEAQLLVRRPGESLRTFGLRIIPKGTSLAHPVLSGDFGPGKSNVVILFHTEQYREVTGWVLVPDDDGFRKYVLPMGPLPVSTEVKAVLFANADRDADRELLILCKHISGVGRHPGNITPFCNTYAFDWNGSGFVALDQVSAYFDSCSTAGVRRRLEKMGY